MIVEKNVKHGCCKRGKVTKEYRAWQNIKKRCYDKTSKDYPFYGGRNIDVCVQWMGSFETFLNDMGLSPNNDYQIDRIDNNGDYSPENCRWVSRKENCNNRRSCLPLITWSDKTQAVRDWSVELGFTSDLLYRRIHILGWDTEKAFTTPARRNRKV